MENCKILLCGNGLNDIYMSPVSPSCEKGPCRNSINDINEKGIEAIVARSTWLFSIKLKQCLERQLYIPKSFDPCQTAQAEQGRYFFTV